MSGQDPESIPTPDEAWMGFLRSFVTLPGGEMAKPILAKKEKEAMQAKAERERQKQEKQETEQKSTPARACHFSFWKCPKQKSPEKSDRSQLATSTTDAQRKCKATAEERKKQLMARMKEQQQKFMRQHQHLLPSSEMKVDTCCRFVLLF